MNRRRRTTTAASEICNIVKRLQYSPLEGMMGRWTSITSTKTTVEATASASSFVHYCCLWIRRMRRQTVTVTTATNHASLSLPFSVYYNSLPYCTHHVKNYHHSYTRRRRTTTTSSTKKIMSWLCGEWQTEYQYIQKQIRITISKSCINIF